jgi:hypothetical protein
MLKPRIAVYTFVAAASLANAGYQPADSAVLEAAHLVSGIAQEAPRSQVAAPQGRHTHPIALAAASR